MNKFFIKFFIILGIFLTLNYISLLVLAKTQDEYIALLENNETELQTAITVNPALKAWRKCNDSKLNVVNECVAWELRKWL